MNRIPPRAEEDPPPKARGWDRVFWVAFVVLMFVIALLGCLAVLPELGY